MSQLKQRINTRSSKQIPTQTKQQQAQKPTQIPKSRPKNTGNKRPLQQKSLLSMFAKKEQNEIIPEPIEVLYNIKQLLKTTSIADIISQCPKVKILYQLLCCKLYNKQKLVLMCLDKYFHGNTISLWYNKYAPRQFNQLFQSDFAEKIQEWIKDFYYFRKDANYAQQSDFINDQSSYSCSQSLQLRMKQYGWNCRALVLKGRNGVGKSSLLTAIAKSMNIRCFQYASDVDQLQKMKQMSDGSQSQCVDKLHNKKKQVQNNKIIKQNSSITKFMPTTNIAKKQSLDTKHPKRMQIFKNFDQYFPPCDKPDKQNAEDNYFRQLFQSINKSPIPYVLTSNQNQFIFREKNLNQKFSKFDQIDFVQNSIQDLTYLYWTIYQIQANLNLTISKKISKNDLFNQLNEQFKNLEIRLIDNIHLIRQLINKSNKKPLYVSKYLQFFVQTKVKALAVDQKQNINKLHLSYLQNAAKQIGTQVIQNISSDDLINNMQWSVYTKAFQQPGPFQQTADTQQQEKSQKSRDKQQLKRKKPSLKQIIKRLDLIVAQDHKIFQNHFFSHKTRQFQTINNEYNEDTFFKIPTQVHIKAKKTLFKNIKSNINSIHSQKQRWQKKSQVFKFGLNQKQMYYLPLLFVTNGTRRSSRSLTKQGNNKQTFQQNFTKLMTPRQFQYLKKFGKFAIVQ